jgi:hypothetical protein
MMVTVMHFDSRGHARFFKNIKVRDGIIEIEGKAFDMTNAVPILTERSFGGYEPIYFLRWDNLQPSDINKNIKDHILTGNPELIKNPELRAKIIVPEFESSTDKYKMTPDMFRKLINLRILGNMIPLRKKPVEVGSWVWMVGGIIAAIVIAYVLVTFNIIPAKLW